MPSKLKRKLRSFLRNSKVCTSTEANGISLPSCREEVYHRQAHPTATATPPATDISHTESHYMSPAIMVPELSESVSRVIENPSSLEPFRVFKRSGGSTRQSDDFKRLYLSYVMNENEDLRNAVVLTERLKRSKIPTDALLQMSCCFILEVADFRQEPRIPVDISEFISILAEMDTMIDSGVDIRHKIQDIDEAIQRVKESHPIRPTETSPFSKFILGSGFVDGSQFILNMLKDGCEIIPVPYVKPAVGLVASLLGAAKQTKCNFSDMQDIAYTASGFILSLAVSCNTDNEYMSANFLGSLDRFTSQLREIVRKCVLSTSKPLVTRILLQENMKNEITKLKTEMEATIRQFQLETQIFHEEEILKLLSLSKSINSKLDLDIIHDLPAQSFQRLQVEDYLPGSRNQVIESLMDWVDTSPTHICLISGLMGIGKTTLAHHIVSSLAEASRLASCFFVQGSMDDQDPVTAVQVLAREMASLHPNMIPSIANAVRVPYSSHQSLLSYLTNLVTDPIRLHAPNIPIVIVLDGLDMWRPASQFIKALCQLKIPPQMKVIITTRPDSEFSQLLAPLNPVTIPLTIFEDSLMKKYIHLRLCPIEWAGRRPTAHQIDALVSHSKGYPLWAVSVCNYISNSARKQEAHKILDHVLASDHGDTSKTQLGSLYMTALAPIFRASGIESKDQKCVLSALLVTQTRMDVHSLEKLLGLPSQIILEIISCLSPFGQMLPQPEGTLNLPLSTCAHPSFIDFVAQTAGDPFPNSMSEAHSIVAEKCLQTLAFLIKGKMAVASSTYHRLQKHVQYALEYWPLHLAFALNSSEHLLDLVEMSIVRQFMNVPWVNAQKTQGGIDETFIEALEKINDPGVALDMIVEKLGTIRGVVLIDVSANELLRRRICIQECAAMLSRNNEHYIQILSRLSELYFEEYILSSKVDYQPLGKSVRIRQQISHALSPSQILYHPSPSRLEHTRAQLNLAHTCTALFQYTGNLKDLDETIKIYRDVLEHSPSTDTRQTDTMNDLAYSLYHRFQLTSSLPDLEESIDLHSEALFKLDALHNPSGRSATLINLGIAQFTRYTVLRFDTDWESSTSRLREALELYTGDNLYRLSVLNNLAAAYYEKFLKNDSQEYLRTATEMYEEALEICPPVHRDRYLLLSNLGSVYFSRHGRNNEGDDLHRSIDLQHEALSLCTISNIQRPTILHNIATALQARYKAEQSLQDLNESISIYKEVMELRSSQHSDSFWTLTNLSDALRTRFKLNHSIEDIKEAIANYEIALSTIPEIHSDRYLLLDKCGSAFRNLFEVSGIDTDLEQSIAMHNDASKIIMPLNIGKRWVPLIHLALTLNIKFNKYGQIDALKEATEAYSKALEIIPQEHAERPKCLYSLADVLLRGAATTKSIRDVEKAVDYFRQAAQISTPQRSHYLSKCESAEALYKEMKKNEKITIKLKKLSLSPALVNAITKRRGRRRGPMSTIVQLPTTAEVVEFTT